MKKLCILVCTAAVLLASQSFAEGFDYESRCENPSLRSKTVENKVVDCLGALASLHLKNVTVTRVEVVGYLDAESSNIGELFSVSSVILNNTTINKMTDIENTLTAIDSVFRDKLMVSNTLTFNNTKSVDIEVGYPINGPERKTHSIYLNNKSQINGNIVFISGFNNKVYISGNSLVNGKVINGTIIYK